MLIAPIKPDDWKSVDQAIKKLNKKLGPLSEPKFRAVTIASTVTVSALVVTTAKVSSMAVDSAAVINLTVDTGMITALSCQSATVSTLCVEYIDFSEKTSLPPKNEGMTMYKDNELYICKQE